ncbi:MAG: hypothetical protein PVI23_15380 [Maricaulaceae bacterium]|jgi:hypothetical protein
MTTSTEEDDLNEGPAWDVPKLRACLRCGVEFESAWSGERICAPCKRSHTWRSG